MIEISRIVELSETIETETDEATDGTTPYGVAKIVNDVFVAIGSTCRIASQMMYQYAKAGRINGVKNAKRFTDEEVETFVAKFVARNK